MAHGDGSIGSVLGKLARTEVLLLADFAMAPMKDSERRDFLEICDDRYQRARPTIELHHGLLGDKRKPPRAMFGVALDSTNIVFHAALCSRRDSRTWKRKSSPTRRGFQRRASKLSR